MRTFHKLDVTGSVPILCHGVVQEAKNLPNQAKRMNLYVQIKAISHRNVIKLKTHLVSRSKAPFWGDFFNMFFFLVRINFLGAWASFSILWRLSCLVLKSRMGLRNWSYLVLWLLRKMSLCLLLRLRNGLRLFLNEACRFGCLFVLLKPFCFLSLIIPSFWMFVLLFVSYSRLFKLGIFYL